MRQAQGDGLAEICRPIRNPASYMDEHPLSKTEKQQNRRCSEHATVKFGGFASAGKTDVASQEPRVERDCDEFFPLCPSIKKLALRHGHGECSVGHWMTTITRLDPEHHERLTHKDLIDYPYGNEPLGRFLLYRKGTN